MMEKSLKEVEKKLGNVKFVIGRASTPEQAAALMQKAGDNAPVLAINLCISGLLRVSAPILESGRPLAVFSAPASGHDWMYPFRWRQEGKPVTMFTSSDYGELERAGPTAARDPVAAQQPCACVPPTAWHPAACSPEQIKSRFGVDVVMVPPGAFSTSCWMGRSGEGRHGSQSLDRRRKADR